MKNEIEEQFEGLQYVGRPGISADCLDAILRFLQFGDTINMAWLLTSNHRHCFLLQINAGSWVAVKSGFGSGYCGEGPKTLSIALQILELHRVEIDEYEVISPLLDRLDRAALSCADFSALQSLPPIRPVRWGRYILGASPATSTAETLWQRFSPVIPFAILDGRIADLALDFFKQPDETLIKGFRRLEETVRTHAQIDGFGSELFRHAFDPQKGALTWGGLSEAEHKGRLNLFIATFGACRNPRAHRAIEEALRDQVSEFLLLNTLFRFEHNSTKRG